MYFYLAIYTRYIWMKSFADKMKGFNEVLKLTF